MASFIFSFIFFLLFLTTTTTARTTVTTTATPPSHPNTTAFPFSLLTHPPSSTHNAAQLNSIIDAVIGATDFSNWANLLAAADVSTVPLSATLFVLADDTDGHRSTPANPLLHVIPRRFSFSELQLFPTGARLPTLVPGAALVVVNNSANNFTVNSARVVKPDMFQNALVSVHGLDRLLENSAHVVIQPPNRRRRQRPRRWYPLPDDHHNAGVKSSCTWRQVAVTVLVGLLVLHVLGLPRIRIVCSLEHGSSASSSQAHFRYFLGCSGNFVI